MKYEPIDLEDYLQSGEGGQSLTYTRKDGGSMAKLFLKYTALKLYYNVCKHNNGKGLPRGKGFRDGVT